MTEIFAPGVVCICTDAHTVFPCSFAAHGFQADSQLLYEYNICQYTYTHVHCKNDVWQVSAQETRGTL